MFRILFATIANHAAAGLAGTLFRRSAQWLADALDSRAVVSQRHFPDKYEGEVETISRRSAFVSTLIALFVNEIGDKTQSATVGLAARFENFYPLVIGTTLDMMAANIPVVLC
jgi:Ca2+/H+ antiporter, TMEM165/GDT1 family